MSTTTISEEEYEKMINSAITNNQLEWYGNYVFEQVAQILGSNEAVNLLLNNGFFDYYVIPKSGVTGGVHSFIILNDRWRRLKRCGNYKALLDSESNEITKEEKRKTDADLFVQYQKENALWQNKLNPLIEKSNLSTITTNKRMQLILWTTALITFAGLLTSIFNTTLGIRKEYDKKLLLQKDSTIQILQKEISGSASQKTK